MSHDNIWIKSILDQENNKYMQGLREDVWHVWEIAERPV